MNRVQKALEATVQCYGSDISAWPRWRRFLLRVFIMLSRNCHQDWQTIKTQANKDEAALVQDYCDNLTELAISDAMARRLQAITEQPQRAVALARVGRVTEGGARFWQISFASAAASVLLGVALGAGGYVEVFSDSEVAYLNVTITYEVSDWLAGDVQ